MHVPVYYISGISPNATLDNYFELGDQSFGHMHVGVVFIELLLVAVITNRACERQRAVEEKQSVESTRSLLLLEQTTDATGVGEVTIESQSFEYLVHMTKRVNSSQTQC